MKLGNPGKSKSPDSQLNFANQVTRFDSKDSRNFKEDLLKEYERTKFLFRFDVLSNDGVILESQKHAFTRCEK